jgi:hypothetical protein
MAFNLNFGIGGGSSGGYAGQGGSESKSEAKFITPDFGKAKGGYDLLQPGIAENELQGRAVKEQQGLRGRIEGLLTQHGEGERARITDTFDTAANNATGGLASRGFSGSSLNIPAQLGVARERNMAEADLNDRLISQRVGADQSITKNISDLLFGASGQSTDLLGSILGAGGIGNFAESSSTNNAPGGGSGGGSSGSGEGYNPRDAFDDWKSQFGSGGGGGGQGSGGGGGGQGQGTPSLIQNPFLQQPGQQDERFKDDPQSQEGIPLEDQELEPDSGPSQTPDAFARNAARLDAKQAAGTPLAGGPGDALGGGMSTPGAGSMA